MIIKILTLLIALSVSASANSINTSEIANLSLAEWNIGYGSYKCYMDYRTITDTASPQWQLQQEAYTDQNGLRKVNGRYCVALASAFGTKVGSKYIVELENGTQCKCILADQKADKDANAQHTADMNGAVVEFVVDAPYLSDTVKSMGDVSYISGMQGKIKKIYKEAK